MTAINNVLVTKRDGTIEAFTVEKVKRCIAWACSGLEVSPLALEAKFDEFLSEEVSSKSIQENLIMSSRMLANKGEPDWTFVAGRLWTMQRWKETGAYDKSFFDYLEDQIESGNYYGDLVDKIFDTYTKEDIVALEKLIDQKRDLEHSYGSVLTANEKYLAGGECIQQMHMVNAMLVGIPEKPSERFTFVADVYDVLSKRKLSKASPWLGNLRQGGNISSCFIIQPDDNIDSIFDNVKNGALISKNGGGLGVSLSRIRAEGSEVNGRKNASKGVFGWARIFNDTALFVDQGGRRAGAFTVQVPIWHKDIEGFLEIQSETGDVRTKAYDIFPQVTVNDYFMELDANNGHEKTWYTFCPNEVKEKLGIELYNVFGKDFTRDYKKCVKAYEQGKLEVVGKHNVRSLFKHIMRTHFDSGLPYTVFIDTINADNPNNHEGNIPSVNLCCESFSVVQPDQYAHSCNLASVVVGRCEDLKEVMKVARIATRILDNGIEITNNPVEISKNHNQRYRTIGVGIQGLHDWFAKEGKSYKDYKEAAKLAEAIQFGCVSESIKLAEERGSYPAFKGSKWDNGEQFEKYKRNKYSSLDWEGLEQDLNKHGIRNSQLTSPAPNTSTSVFQDAGAGVMPVYMDFYQKDNGNGTFPFASMHLKTAPLSYAKNASRWEHEHLVKTVAEIQKYTCAGISSEFFLDHNKENFSAKELYDLIHMAWRSKIKALYYIRHIKKGKSYTDEIGISEAACDGCAD